MAWLNDMYGRRQLGYELMTCMKKCVSSRAQNAIPFLLGTVSNLQSNPTCMSKDPPDFFSTEPLYVTEPSPLGVGQ